VILGDIAFLSPCPLLALSSRMSNQTLIQADAERGGGIGLLLRQRREELVWSVEEVVRKTGIPKHAITAIDLENYYAFWGNAPVLDSYIRLYAKKIGFSLLMHEHLITKAKNSIKPSNPGVEFINEAKLGR
jgi:cytoskeletal protein RodZ